MSNTYYTSLSGMLAASFGLQNTSHNIANLQSPGFKRNDVFYSSLGDGGRQNNLGFGVKVGGFCTNFKAGNYSETGNPTDLAVVGQGFFIVRLKNGELVYTRDGEFRFNDEGLLEDKHSGGLVQGYDKNKNLVPIQKFGSKTNKGKETSLVDLAGEFILKKNTGSLDPDPEKSNFENIKFTLATIFDKEGKEHSLTIELKPKGSKQEIFDGVDWELISVSYDNVDIGFASQNLRFSSQEGGAPEQGSNEINLKLPNNQAISLKFGTYMSDQDKSVRTKKADPSKTNSTINIYKQDGYPVGKQIGFAWNENGQIIYNYDNKQTEEGIYLALANFDDLENTLLQTSDNLFRAKTDSGKQIGRANKGGFGAIQAKKLESSNVDSTTEFANIVVLQRMFQACSQIMDIDKQLLEELYK